MAYFVEMTKQLTIIFFIAFLYQSQAQVIRHFITGRISNDSISVESIHVLNKNTKKGTISNQFGMFKIPVKENDTLIFEGIQFKSKEIVVTQKMINTKSFEVTLIQNVNELATVEIKNINLTGDLLNDAKNVKKPVSMVSKNALDFSNIDFNVVDDIDAIDRQKPPDPFTGTSAQFHGGGNILGLLGFVLDPLMKEVSEIGAHKRKRKRAKKAYQKEALKAPDKIRKDLGDVFFEEQLKIPKAQIDAFILYCKPKGVVDLFMADKKIEMIEVLMAESKTYIKTQN